AVEIRIERRRGKLALLPARESDQLTDGAGDLLAALVAELDGAEDLRFGDLPRAGFDHDDAVLGAGHHDVQRRFAALRVSRIRDISPVLHADADAAQN